MRQVQIHLLVAESDVDELLVELAEDDRVKAATAELGEGKYRVPERVRPE